MLGRTALRPWFAAIDLGFGRQDRMAVAKFFARNGDLTLPNKM